MRTDIKWGNPIPARIAQRAAENVTIDDETGCWVSNYAKQGAGYATLSEQIEKTPRRVRIHLAHRASWTHANGPIPAGMTVDHMCFNRACVNPEHLRLLTNAQNAARQDGYDFPLTGECGNGHPASSRKTAKWGKVPAQTYCADCLTERNDRGLALKRLEHVYGIRLTKKQQAMVDEFLPQHERFEQAS